MNHPELFAPVRRSNAANRCADCKAELMRGRLRCSPCLKRASNARVAARKRHQEAR